MYGTITLFGLTFQSCSITFTQSTLLQFLTPVILLLLVWALTRSLATTQVIVNLLSFPPDTQMVQFSGFPPHTLCIHVWVLADQCQCVPTFGHLRIKVCLRLPVAFRSLPRPSSASNAKASTIRSFSLDRIFYRIP